MAMQQTWEMIVIAWGPTHFDLKKCGIHRATMMIYQRDKIGYIYISINNRD
jgi:hypothetical protein